MSDLLYMTTVKHTLVKALKMALAVHPTAEWSAYADRVSIEYPMKEEQYPSFWVDFDPAGALRTVGIGHAEYQGSQHQEVRRWSFEGRATYTAVAMTSTERDRLVDMLVTIFAFGQSPAGAAFRSTIEADQFVGLKANLDEIDQVGFSASPGTPWGTDDMLYEGTLAIDVVGEFVSDPGGNAVLLSSYDVVQFELGSPDPDTGGDWFHEVPYPA